MNITRQISSLLEPFAGLPAWLASTPTGKKILSEREAAERKSAEESAAERIRLAADYQAAAKAESGDLELAALRKQYADLLEASREKKTGRILGPAVMELRKLQNAISRRACQHREKVTRLRDQLRESAPAEILAFTGKLQAMAEETRTLKIEAFDIESIEGFVPMAPEGVMEYRTLGPSQAKRLAGIERAIGAAKKLGVEALTAAELHTRFEAIEKTIPALTASRFARKTLGGVFVAA